MARPWSLVEREKPAISLGGQDEPDFSYTYGVTDGEGDPLYGTALTASGPAGFKHKPSADDNSVTVLVKSGGCGDYFDGLIISSIKHHLLNYAFLTTPRNILTHRGHCWTARPKGYFKASSPTTTGNNILRGLLPSLYLA